MLDTSDLTFDRLEDNVVYGMYSGLALLLDVYHPSKANGLGVVHVSGSGWNAPLNADAAPLKASTHVAIEAFPLVEAGYTVFTINHRAAPRFRWPDPFLDCQRAVRFVRHHAGRFGIDADRIGAIGGSSAGHLVALLGVRGDDGDPEAESSVDRNSAAVQCVVARAGVYDLAAFDMPMPLFGYTIPTEPGSEEHRLGRQASPIFQITGQIPPFLLTVGENDHPEATRRMHDALVAAGGTVKLVVVPGASHGPHYPGATIDIAAIQREYVAWFEEHL